MTMHLQHPNNAAITSPELAEELRLPTFAERLDRAKAQAAASRKPKRKKQPEQVIQDEVSKYLIANGWLVIQHLSGVMMRERDSVPFPTYRIRNLGSTKGLSDLTAHKNGRSLFLEIKTASGRQQESQATFQQLCEKHGMEYYLIRRVDDVLALINER